MSVCVFATEVSALIGDDPHRTQAEAEAEILSRCLGQAGGGSPDPATGFEAYPEIDTCIRAFQSEPHVSRELTLRYLDNIREAVDTQQEGGSTSPERFRKLQNRAVGTIRRLSGTRAEQQFITRYNIPGSQREFKKKLHSHSCFYLYGKVDGFDTEKQSVIEIKTRHEQKGSRLYPWEYTQLMCYMFLTETRTVRFIELFGDDETHTEMVVGFEDTKWLALFSRLMAACRRLANKIEKSREHYPETLHRLL